MGVGEISAGQRASGSRRRPRSQAHGRDWPGDRPAGSTAPLPRDGSRRASLPSCLREGAFPAWCLCCPTAGRSEHRERSHEVGRKREKLRESKILFRYVCV